LSGALVARREKMNKEEFEKAIAEVAERLSLYLDQQVGPFIPGCYHPNHLYGCCSFSESGFA
jgi:hypothetical protein